VIIAFNRLDYFRKKFEEANEKNYQAALGAGIASNVFIPIYGLAFNLAALIGLCYGLYLAGAGEMTIGLLISFQLYINNFYTPLRQLAAIWPAFQLALASLDRIGEVLNLKSNIKVVPGEKAKKTNMMIEFKQV